MRLGRLIHSPDALAAAPAHRLASVMPAPRLDRSLSDWTPGLYDNDCLPDCTFVSLANAARGVAYLNGYDLALDAALVPVAYADCVGVPLAQAGTTDGARMLDVLAWQGVHGFDIGAQRLVAIGGTVPITRVTLARAMERLGPLWCGVTLHDREAEAWGTGTVWDIQDGRDDGAVVGGHAVPVWTYDGLTDTSRVWIGTWGVWQAVTWSWIYARMDEAHGLVWRQLARADGLFYGGLTADGLIREIARA